MRLLFDQNLSPRLVEALRDVFPGSATSRPRDSTAPPMKKSSTTLGSMDTFVVTKDADFHELSRKHGAPPKVVWLGTGNCKTRRVEELLRECREEFSEMAEDASRRLFRLLP